MYEALSFHPYFFLEQHNDIIRDITVCETLITVDMTEKRKKVTQFHEECTTRVTNHWAKNIKQEPEQR